MFGPNKTDIIVPNTDIHHRGDSFKELYKQFKHIFRKKFNISNNYDILLYNGSGSQTIEKIIQSLNFDLQHPFENGKFESRWSKMSKFYKKNQLKDSNNNLIVQFETSISKSRLADGEYFVDSVCAFPYFDLPNDFKILVTVSSKLIGAAPVLGIVIYDKTILDDLDPSVPGGFLDWINYSESSQTPYTPSISLIKSLNNEIKDININELKFKIDYVSDLILDIVGPSAIYGDKKGPAISIDKKNINLKRCEQLEIYGMHTTNDFIQIFTYSDTIEKYERILPQILIK